MIEGAKTRLLSQYVRAGTLHAMRRMLGERRYKRLRSKLIDG